MTVLFPWLRDLVSERRAGSGQHTCDGSGKLHATRLLWISDSLLRAGGMGRRLWLRLSTTRLGQQILRKQSWVPYSWFQPIFRGSDISSKADIRQWGLLHQPLLSIWRRLNHGSEARVQRLEITCAQRRRHYCLNFGVTGLHNRSSLPPKNLTFEICFCRHLIKVHHNACRGGVSEPRADQRSTVLR